ncbi:hypothetical protein ACFQZE_09950 [Paenibacillus sp. GCM10027627]|uniref:hypothetical protein n=1 Tax=unclassified Paenibacillus TaxID=185978 RepID=UPI00362AF26D
MTSGSQPSHKLLNQSTVSFRSGNTEHVAYSNTVATPLVGPKFELSKRAEPDCAALDDIITYRLKLSNSGNRGAEVVLYDALPEGTVFVANSLLIDGVPLPGVKPGSGIPLGVIEPKTTVRIVFQVLISFLPPELKLVNQARAEYVFYTIDERRFTGTVLSNSVKIKVEGARFSAHLKASADYTYVCDTVSFMLVVANRGNNRMNNTLLSLLLPPEAELVRGSVVVDDVCMPSLDHGEEIAVGHIDPGRTVQVAFRIKTASAPINPFLIIQALVRCDIKGIKYEEATNKVKLKVICPEVVVHKTASAGSVTRGDTLRYELRVRNDSGFAIDAVLRDCLPEGALFVWDSVKIDGKREKGFQPSEGIPLGTIRAFTAVAVAFDVTVPSAAIDGSDGVWTNKAKLGYTYPLPDGRKVLEEVWSNPVDTALVAPIIRLTIKPLSPYAEAGSRIAFEAELSNAGNLAADVVLSRLIPPETEVVPGSIRIVGRGDAEWLPSGLLPLGTVEPRERIRIRYEVLLNEVVESSIVRGHAIARYTYELNGKPYGDVVRSNGYQVEVEEHNE